MSAWRWLSPATWLCRPAGRRSPPSSGGLSPGPKRKAAQSHKDAPSRRLKGTPMTILSLTPDLAGQFADIALGHVRREYPNKPDHVLAGPQDARTPSQLHPIFYGSYDWHSCVPSYWMLARLLRRFPHQRAAAAIR